MSDAKSKPTTLKGILTLVGAGLVYLVSQLLGIDLSGLMGGEGKGNPPVTAPADPAPSKEVAKNEPKPSTGKTLEGKKPAAPKKDDSAAKPEQRDDTALIKKLFQTMQSDAQVEAEGTVVVLLADDTDETPHQRFLVELSNDITVKIAHNTKISPYLPLKVGDKIRFHGEYEYNDKGGVVHWTHRTLGTRNKHPHGWLLHKGKKYD